MSLSISILASGSSGNCSVLRASEGAILIDCGIGPRAAAKRMAGLGVGLDDISSICLTHLDSDHFNPNWIGEIIRREIRVHCHQSHRAQLLERAPELGSKKLIECFNGHAFEPISGVEARSIHLEHDETGSHGFRFHQAGCRIGYASDLGRVRRELIEMFDDCDVLAIESNYDPEMQRASGRPWFLQQRIMGGKGHLSNAQALEAVRKILDHREQIRRSLPRHIVLLHRSRQCNCPELVRELFQSDERIAGRLVLAEQGCRTDWLSARHDPMHTGLQLELNWNERIHS